MKRTINLSVWLDIYDSIDSEMDSIVEQTNWIYENIGRPFPDDAHEELVELDNQFHRMMMLQKYVRSRILKYESR